MEPTNFNSKNDPFPNVPQVKQIRSNSMNFSVILNEMNKLITEAKESSFKSQRSKEVFTSCLYCTRQKECMLRESASNYASNLVKITEHDQIVLIIEPLMMFTAKCCEAFEQIPDKIFK